jgi:hypothetical protein
MFHAPFFSFRFSIQAPGGRFPGTSRKKDLRTPFSAFAAGQSACEGSLPKAAKSLSGQEAPAGST